jgi:hypothetical protein
MSTAAQPRLRDRLHDLAGLLLLLGERDVRLREDADEPLVLDDRQAAHLVTGHQPQRHVEVVVGCRGHGLARCDLTHGHRLRIHGLGHDTNRNVPVGDHAHQAPVLEHGQRSDVSVPHQASRLDHGLARLH